MKRRNIYRKKFGTQNEYNIAFQDLVDGKLITPAEKHLPSIRKNRGYAIYLPGSDFYRNPNIKWKEIIVYMDTSYEVPKILQKLFEDYKFEFYLEAQEPDFVYLGQFDTASTLHFFFMRMNKDTQAGYSTQASIANKLAFCNIEGKLTPQTVSLITPPILTELEEYRYWGGLDFEEVTAKLLKKNKIKLKFIRESLYVVPELDNAVRIIDNLRTFYKKHGFFGLFQKYQNDMTDINEDFLKTLIH